MELFDWASLGIPNCDVFSMGHVEIHYVQQIWEYVREWCEMVGVVEVLTLRFIKCLAWHSGMQSAWLEKGGAWCYHDYDCHYSLFLQNVLVQKIVSKCWFLIFFGVKVHSYNFILFVYSRRCHNSCFCCRFRKLLNFMGCGLKVSPFTKNLRHGLS